MSIPESRVGLMAFASHFVMFLNLRAHNPASKDWCTCVFSKYDNKRHQTSDHKEEIRGYK